MAGNSFLILWKHGWQTPCSSANMSHEEAVEKCNEYLHLVDRPFLNSNDEKETIKAVVAWDEGDGNWQPHVCFYNWASNKEGHMSHMRAADFLKSFQMIEDR